MVLYWICIEYEWLLFLNNQTVTRGWSPFSTKCLLYAYLTEIYIWDTSLHLESVGQVCQEPIERSSQNCSTAHSPEPRLHSNDWELEESQEKDSSRKVGQVLKPFGLTILMPMYCSASATFRMFFRLMWRSNFIFLPIYIEYLLLPAIPHS